MRDFFGDKFNLPETEEKVLEFWKSHNIFGKSLLQNKPKSPASPAGRSNLKAQRFVFYEGPPTANGKPGIHHVLARSFKDVIPRFKTMQGYFVPRKGGWDTHGLPVELGVEKALGLKSKKEIEQYGVAAFNQKCKESVWEYKDLWEKLTERMGFWLDMKDPYITYENGYMETLWWIIRQIWDKKLLYKGHKVVPWCTRCGTALSSHELGQPGAYKEVTENSVYVKFKLKATSDTRHETRIGNQEFKNIYVLSWTTTPWTLPGNVALAVGEKITYIVFRDKRQETRDKEFFIAAEDRFNDIFKENYEIISEINGKDLVGLKYEPLFNIPALQTEKSYKIYLADFVTTTDGTGVVHTAVMYGEDDYQLGLKVGLPQHHTVNEDGKFRSEVPGLSGLYVKSKETEEKIFNHLKIKKWLLKIQPFKHEYPHCWRCDTPLLYYARTSWFVAMSKLREKLIKGNKTINWVPEHVKEGRFGEWLKEVKDWNFSRERYWGTPLPIWECQKCGHSTAIGGFRELESLLPSARNKYIFLRHGEGEQNLKNISNANPKNKDLFKLTLKGHVRAEKAGRKLKKDGIDLIFASDFRRTKETAEIVGDILGKKVQFDERLRETNIGIFDGQASEVYHNYFSSYLEKFSKTPPEGENLKQLAARLYSFLRETEKKYDGKTILIVSHEYPIWMAETVISGWDEKESVAEKMRRGNDFVKFAEPENMIFRNLPRNENGFVDYHKPYIDAVRIPCPKCTLRDASGQANKMTRVKEVADVWFDSGAMPFAQAHFPFGNADQRRLDAELRGRGQRKSALSQRQSAPLLDYPADYICEAQDQTRGWFYTLLAVATTLGYEAPYKNVISLGLIHDKNGRKMSKSWGNVVDPWEMMKKYGVDAVRWYFYSATPPGEQKNFDELEILKTSRRIHMMLYNSLAFLKTYSVQIPNSKFQIPNKSILDKWIIVRLNETIAETTKNLERYDIRGAVLAIETLADDLSRWYIRRSRKRFSAVLNGATAAEKNDAQNASATLGFVLLELSKLMAPFSPFFSEALYASLHGLTQTEHGLKRKGSHGLVSGSRESVHLADWPLYNKALIAKSKSLIAQMQEVRRLASIGLAKRTEAGIKVRQPLAKLTISNQSLINSRIFAKNSRGKISDRLAIELSKILADEVNVKEVIFAKKLAKSKTSPASSATPTLPTEVELDTTITQELREEGLVREIGRMAQELRQKAGLKPADKIILMLELPQAAREAIQKNEVFFKKDVGAKIVEYKKSDKFEADESAKVEEGEVWLGLRKT